MSKIVYLSVILLFAAFAVKAQDPVSPVKDTAVTSTVKIDTLKPVYVNAGKIAGRRAAIRSAIVPGLGQIGNGVTVYRVAKVAAIYTGATLLTISYLENTRQYKRYLTELQDRVNNGGEPLPDSPLRNISTTALTNAKDTYSRNRWIIYFSYGALYAVNIIEAYVDARLKYFDVGEDLSFKISPSLNNSAMGLYGYTPVAPGLKLTIKL